MFRAIAASLFIGVLVVAFSAIRWRAESSPTIIGFDHVEGVWVGGVSWRHAKRPGQLRVFPSEADWTDSTYPSVQGSIEQSQGDVRFRPRYPFSRGAQYVIVWKPLHADSQFLVTDFTIPRSDDNGGARVAELYPSGDVLPENQLKMYLHFTTAMERRDTYEHLHLIDAETGEEMEAVFHAMRSGLWDASGTRLTIVFDPGRVKRGLANRAAFGPPIVEGRRYRLVVDSAWPDATGQPMVAGFEKTFVVTAPDKVSPDPTRWQVTTPDVKTREPMVMSFDEPLDHALLASAFRVGSTSGFVDGHMSIHDDEREWWFIPHTPWEAGAYTVHVDCQLEDLAGNNLVRLFDVDLMSGENAHVETKDCPSVVPFTIADRDAQSNPIRRNTSE